MRYALLIALMSMLLSGADRKSWSRVRYLGGSAEVKTSRYDWNTTVTVTPALVTITIDPAKAFTERYSLRIKPSEITGLCYGPGAWRRVSDRVLPSWTSRPGPVIWP